MFCLNLYYFFLIYFFYKPAIFRSVSMTVKMSFFVKQATAWLGILILNGFSVYQHKRKKIKYKIAAKKAVTVTGGPSFVFV